ncbi:MAG: hypothetical protein KAS32_22050 [Candidatus Peribacteraceae bacterium]|nr:hypothetical protein [Candidatus Peribacteraceae bacterium]
MEAAVERRMLEQFKEIRQIESPIELNDRCHMELKQVKEGGCLRIDGFTYRVQEVGRYEEKEDGGTWVWYELKLYCLETGQTVDLEWEFDDEYEISFTVKKLKKKDIKYDDGSAFVMGDVEEAIEEEEDLVVSGKIFEYDDDSETTYFRNNGDKGEFVRLYDFKSTSTDEGLTIEEWGTKGSYEYIAFVSRPVKARDIEIISLSGLSVN